MTTTLADTERFKGVVEGLIAKYILRSGAGVATLEFLAELYRQAVNESTRFVGSMSEPNHRTGVNNAQIDFNMIMMSVIGISWAVRMRKVKSVEGQCHEHTRDCLVTKELHRQIYDHWIEVIEQLLAVLKSDKPPPAQRPTPDTTPSSGSPSSPAV